jgi:hypothetical protein
MHQTNYKEWIWKAVDLQIMIWGLITPNGYLWLSTWMVIREILRLVQGSSM